MTEGTVKTLTDAVELHAEICRLARLHGENDDPDHEVGDLQDALQHCLTLMTEEQCKELVVLLNKDAPEEDEPAQSR